VRLHVRLEVELTTCVRQRAWVGKCVPHDTPTVRNVDSIMRLSFVDEGVDVIAEFGGEFHERLFLLVAQRAVIYG
jgi:hypothetical protein